MTDAYLAALQLAFSYSLDMVAWSAGLMAFSATLLPSEDPSRSERTILIVMFIIYAASVLSGIFCLSTTIGFLTDTSAEANELRDGNTIPPMILNGATIQFLSFFTALILNVVLGIRRHLGRTTRRPS